MHLLTSGQNRQKRSEEVRFPYYCHIVKNALLQIAFSAISPTGYAKNRRQLAIHRLADSPILEQNTKRNYFRVNNT